MRRVMIPSIIVTIAALISFIFAGDTTFGIDRSAIRQNQNNVNATENGQVDLSKMSFLELSEYLKKREQVTEQWKKSLELRNQYWQKKREAEAAKGNEELKNTSGDADPTKAVAKQLIKVAKKMLEKTPEYEKVPKVIGPRFGAFLGGVGVFLTPSEIGDESEELEAYKLKMEDKKTEKDLQKARDATNAVEQKAAENIKANDAAKQEKAEQEDFERKIVEKVVAENARSAAEERETGTDRTTEENEPGVGIKDKNIVETDKTNEFTDNNKSESQNDTEMYAEKQDNKTDEDLKREDVIDDALGQIREDKAKMEKEHEVDSKNALENATKETDQENTLTKNESDKEMQDNQEIDSEFENDMDNVASNKDSSDEYTDMFDSETNAIASAYNESHKEDTYTASAGNDSYHEGSNRSYSSYNSGNDNYYNKDMENYSSYNETKAKSKRKKDSNSDWARILGESLTNTGAAVLGGMAAQQQAQNAARIAENIRRQEEYRRQVAEREKYLQEMRDRRYQEEQARAYQDKLNAEARRREEAEALEAKKRDEEVARLLAERNRREEEEAARLLAERKRREEEDAARLLAERNRQDAARHLIDVSGFDRHEPWNPRSSNLSPGPLDDYSNVDYGTQEDRDYWESHPDAAADRRLEDSYSGSNQGYEIPYDGE